MTTRILIVDDETDFLDSVTRMLRMEGYSDITAVSVPTQVEALVEDQEFDVAFLDVTMPEMDGIEVLSVIKEKSPGTECVMVTADERIPTVIQAVRAGAYDYLIKPITPDEMRIVLDRALERRHLLESLRLRSSGAMTGTLEKPEIFADIVTQNRRMLRLLREAELHARSEIPMLVTGDTGVGKELMARAIHAASHRADGPLVAVNMLALSPTLFESEFFGHVRGAFTGADRDHKGYLAQAKGGTLFLDEIGDLSMEIQGKLLRILQEGEFAQVGTTKAERADVRFIAATNQDLEKKVQQHLFRKDLFYRLQFAHLHIPALKDRADDISLLATHFLSTSAQPDARLTEEAKNSLVAHAWNGNVRELRGVLEAAANLAADGPIKPEHLKIPRAPKQAKGPKAAPSDAARTQVGDSEPLASVERRHILAVYESTGNNKSQTAGHGCHSYENHHV